MKRSRKTSKIGSEKEREQFLANILRESMDAIVSITHDRKIRNWNKGAEEIFGYTEAEIVGKSFTVLVPQNLLDEGELDKLRAQVLSLGYLRNYVTQRLRKDGSSVTVSETATLIKGTNGEPIGRAIIMRDITETIRIQDQMTQNERVFVLGTLSACLAHEVKNPLNTINLHLELLRKSLEKNLRQNIERTDEKYLGVIRAEVDRLDKILEEFLTFAKPGAVAFERTNLNQVVQGVTHFLAPEARKRGVQIDLNLAGSLKDIAGDENQLKQVLVNLLLNSFQAMANGGKIIVKTRNLPKGEALLSVSDTGAGIREEDQTHVFDVFFTTKKFGSGLGLSTVAQIVKRHHGQVRFESEEGNGTTFYISFPVLTESKANVDRHSSADLPLLPEWVNPLHAGTEKSR